MTNSNAAQAYAIIRALRPHASRIVATMEGPHRWAARTAHAANSRLVDRRYHVPRADQDWRAGIIQRETTEREEAYVQRLLEICRLEQIDTIFPSFDPLVYVLAKARDRFKGVLIPVPAYDTLLVALDKRRTIEAAQQAGFPCPRTYVPADDADAARIARDLPAPWVLKRRFTAGGEGMAFFTDADALRRAVGAVSDPREMPMIQEFIPGRERQNFYLVADRSSEVTAVLCPRVVRYASRLYNDNFGSVESASAHLLAPEVARLVRAIKWTGTLTLQTKVDRRDGLPKLLEMNPRVGLHLWYRTALGFNEPMACLQIARGEDVPPYHYPVGTLLLTPLEDSLRVGVDLLDRLIYRVRGGPPIDPDNPPRPIGERVRAYARDYLGARPRAFSPYWRHLLDDPLPCLLWWYAYAGFCARSLRTLGR